MFIHGHNEAAEELVDDVERQVEEQTGQRLEEVEGSIKIRQRRSIGFGVIAHTAFKRYPKRTVLGLSLFIGQAFLYNAVFFTQALVLTTFFKVSDSIVPAYIIPFAFGNLLGPLLLGHLFDTVGRRTMITLCYTLSGVLLIGTGLLFNAGPCRPPP
jgi:MFS family permease